MSHAAMQLLRRAGSWPAVLELLDLPPVTEKAKLEPGILALRNLARRAGRGAGSRGARKQRNTSVTRS